MTRDGLRKQILEMAQDVGALSYGQFTLASGKQSSYYFDGRLLSLDPEGAHLIAQLSELFLALGVGVVRPFGGEEQFRIYVRYLVDRIPGIARKCAGRLPCARSCSTRANSTARIATAAPG